MLVVCIVPCPIGMGVVGTGNLGAHEAFNHKESLHGCDQVASVVAPSDGRQEVHCVLHPCWTNLLDLDVDPKMSGGSVAVLDGLGGNEVVEGSPSFLPLNAWAVTSVRDHLTCHDLIVEWV